MSKRSREEEATWCTIESDPGKFEKSFDNNFHEFKGIFTLLIEKLGVKGVQVEEIYELEPSNLPYSYKCLIHSTKYDHLFVFLNSRSSVLGFIFLFKWSKESSEKEVVEQFSDDPTVFFAKQVTLLYNVVHIVIVNFF